MPPRRQRETPARLTPLPENVSRVNRPATLYNAYIPEDGTYIDMPFDPTESWRDCILHPVQDQNDSFWRRQQERYFNSAAKGHPLLDEEEAITVANDISKNEALEHLDNADDGAGGALISTFDQSVYYNKKKNYDHMLWLYENHLLPTLRYSQSTGTYEFLQPGQTSEIHQYQELMRDQQQYSASDMADSLYHTQAREESPYGHFAEDYESDANDGEGEGEVEIEVETEDESESGSETDEQEGGT